MAIETRDDTLNAAKAAAVIGVVLTVAALGAYGSKSAFSVAVGAAIAVANLLTLRAIIRALVPAPTPADAASEHTDEEPTDARDAEEDAEADHADRGRRGGAAWGIFAVLKSLVLFGGIWFLLTRKLVDPIPLVVGYGVLPLGIAASTVKSLRSLRSSSTSKGRR